MRAPLQSYSTPPLHEARDRQRFVQPAINHTALEDPAVSLYKPSTRTSNQERLLSNRPSPDPKAGATKLVAPDSREAAATGHLFSAPFRHLEDRTPADAPRDAAEPNNRGFYIEISPLDTSSEGDYFQTSTHRKKTGSSNLYSLVASLFSRLFSSSCSSSLTMGCRIQTLVWGAQNPQNGANISQKL